MDDEKDDRPRFLVAYWIGSRTDEAKTDLRRKTLKAAFVLAEDYRERGFSAGVIPA